MATKTITASISARVTNAGAIARARRSVVSATQECVTTIDAARTRPVVVTNSTSAAMNIAVSVEKNISSTISGTTGFAAGAISRNRHLELSVGATYDHVIAISRNRRVAASETTAVEHRAFVTALRGPKEFAYYDLTSGKIIGRGTINDIASITPPGGNAQNLGIARVSAAVAQDTHYINTSTLAATAKGSNTASIDHTSVAAGATATISSLENGSQVRIEPQNVGGISQSLVVDHSTGSSTFASNAPGTYNITVSQPTKADYTVVVTVT